MGSIDFSIQQIIKCLQYQPGETVTVIGDNTTKNVFDSGIMILEPKYSFNLDNYKRPISADDIPEEIAGALTDSDLVFYAIDKVADDKVSELDFRQEINRLSEDCGKLGRVGNLLGMNDEALVSMFNYDIDKIVEFTYRLQDYMRKVSAVKVTNPAGTDIVIDFGNSDSWQASTGFIERKKTRNVAPAEIFVKPLAAMGRIAIDGMYGRFTEMPEFKNNIGEVMRKLELNPVYWHIEGQRIANVECSNPKIHNAVLEYVMGSVDSDSNVFDEFGLGTNFGIKKLLGIVMHDEKAPDLHCANGNRYSNLTLDRIDRQKPFKHSDGMIRKTTIQNLDNMNYFLMDGTYILSEIMSKSYISIP